MSNFQRGEVTYTVQYQFPHMLEFKNDNPNAVYTKREDALAHIGRRDDYSCHWRIIETHPAVPKPKPKTAAEILAKIRDRVADSSITHILADDIRRYLAGDF